VLPILEPIAVRRVKEDVILKSLYIIDFLDFTLQGLVDDDRLSHGVLGEQVGRDAVLDVFVDEFDLCRVEVVGLIEADDVADQVFRAVDLGLVVAHVAAFEVVEGS
jgi:hypothetical protein